MKIAACLLAILMMLSAGMGFTAWLWRGGRAILAAEWLGLGWMFGAGLVSLALALGGTVLPGSLLLPIVAIACLLLGLLGLTRWRQGFKVKTGLTDAPGWEKWLSLLVLVPIFYVAYATFRDALLWDGLVVWELKARHAFLAGGNLPPTYFADATRARFHPSYPLYLPFTELWTYLWMGDCDQTLMKLIFPLFYAAAVLLLWSAVRRLTGKVWAATATSLLPIFIPVMADHGLGLVEGYVDFLLATMYLAGLAALLAWRVQGLESGWRVAVACAAFLPWMKQDGLMLLVSLIAVAALVHGFAGWRRTLLFALPGIAVVLAWKLAMRAVHAVDESVFQPVTLDTLSHNLPRLAPIAREMGQQLSQLKNWSLLWYAVPVALICLVWRQRRLGCWLMAALVVPLGLDMIPYLFTQLNLRFHIVTSFDRLALQISLVAVFCLGLALAGAETSQEALPPENKDQDVAG